MKLQDFNGRGGCTDVQLEVSRDLILAGPCTTVCGPARPIAAVIALATFYPKTAGGLLAIANELS